MHYFSQIRNNAVSHLLSVCIYAVLMFFNAPTSAQVVEDVTVKHSERVYELEISFFIPLRVQSHSPKKSGRTLEIQLREENFADPEFSDRFDERSILSFDRGSGIPLREIFLEGVFPRNPSLIVRFTENVKFKVRNSADLRSVIISIETAKPSSKRKAEEVPIVSSENLITALKSSDPKLADLLDEANNAMLDENYSRAIQLFTKIRGESNEEVRKHVQELLGVAREYNGQLAHAKAEYQKFLEDYPEGEDAKRVKQRLTALITAPEKPREKLKAGRRQRTQDGSEWDTQFYGSFSQIYFRDETTPEEEDTILVRSDLTNDLDFVARARKGDYDLRTQFIGSYREDLRSDGEGGEFLPSVVSVEGRHSGLGIFARLGRQSITTGGILGRFDGVHAAYEINSAVTLNTVFGYPIDFSDRTKINTDQELYGVNVDVGPLWDGWSFNAFYATQYNAGIKDREAVGGEIRYFDPRKSLFTLVDYDVSYSDLNIFLFIGSWTIVDGTTLNLVVDYRNSPILTTTNAITGLQVQGVERLQGVEDLDELLDLNLFSEGEINQLAVDRTFDSKSLTAGVTHQLMERLQVIGEFTVTEFGGTKGTEFGDTTFDSDNQPVVSPGGVADIQPVDGTGLEFLYSAQLIANSLVFENNDIAILDLRYADTFNADTYSINLNWRVNVDRNKFRLNPRIRVDYRKNKEDGDNSWIVRPRIRADYRFKKWLKFELELGYEWRDETFSGESQSTNGYFLSVGYRAQF